jgi:RNA polymerase sigma-70 factor (ECF subfamily)
MMRYPKPAARPDVATERFERLFRIHHAAVVAYVRRRAPADVVDDIVSETFLVAWRRLDRVPGEPLPWLLAVARNVLATQRRGGRRRHALTLRLGRATAEGSADTEPLVPRAGHALDDRLAGALAKLASKDREALTLVAWDGLEPHEAAFVLGESPGTFRVRLHRARGRLRGLLEERTEPVRPAAWRAIRLEETAHDR